ncbi:MAG: helix-turn-helix domain-containing protein [Pseudomonadota bacterium]
MFTDAKLSKSLEPAALMDAKAVASFLGVHSATVWRKARDGELPKPIKIAGRTMWRRDEILASIDAATATRDIA